MGFITWDAWTPSIIRGAIDFEWRLGEREPSTWAKNGFTNNSKVQVKLVSWLRAPEGGRENDGWLVTCDLEEEKMGKPREGPWKRKIAPPSYEPSSSCR